MGIEPGDIEVRMPARQNPTQQPAQQTAQEEVSFSVDWRMVGLLIIAGVVGVVGWHAHGWFVHPTYTKARAQIESILGSDVALAYEESNRACPDNMNLTTACGLLIQEIKSPRPKIASAE